MITAALDRLRVFNVRENYGHLGRTLMSLAVVAVSAALLVAVIGLTGSITGSVDRLTTSLGGNVDLEISGISDGGFDAALLPAITQVSGVEAAVPMVRAPIGSGNDRVILIGADQSISKLQSDLRRALENQQAGAAKLLTTPNGVIVGTALGKAAGETFQLGGTPVTVVATVDEQRLNGGHFVLALLPVAQRIAGRPGHLDAISIVLGRGANIDRVRADLNEVVAGRAIVADPSFRAAQASGAISLLRASTLLSASASLVVAGFLVYIAMSMAISQRRPMISMLRAIGGRRGTIVRDLLAEAALLSVVGGVIGALAGIFVGRFAIGQLPPAIVQSIDARIEYVLPGYAIPVAVLACLLAGVLAAAVAARQVYKVAPIEALAPIEVVQSNAPNRALQVITALVGIGVGAGAVWVASADLGRLAILSVSLMILSAISLCFLLTEPIVAAAAAVARLFGAPGTLAATTILRAPRRVWATLMTVLIAVVAMVSITATNSDVVGAATDSWSSMADADLYVSTTAPDVIPTAPLLPADLLPKITAIPGVRQVVPGQITFATLNDLRVTIFGTAPGSPNQMYTKASDQIRAEVDAGAGVLLSKDVARSLGVTVDDYVRMPTPLGVQRVRVLDVLPYFSGLSGAVVLDLKQLEQWFDRPGATNFSIELTPGTDLERLKAEIRNVTPPDAFVYTAQEGIDGVSSAAKQATVLSAAITWIITGVAAIALLNTLMLSVLERRRELGVLRAIGSSRRFALRMVLAEAAGIGLCGGVLGLIVGALSQYLNTIALSNVLTVDVTYHASPMMFVFAGLAVTLSMLGALPPAVRAARLDIVDALAVD